MMNSNSIPEPLALGRRVLVVDDNVDAADSLASILRLLGHHVAVAHDGIAGVHIFETTAPEIVLMDIGMPVMNGLDAGRLIRRSLLAPQPLLVALTGWGQDTDRQKSKEAGFDHHLVKPIEFEELEEILLRGPSAFRAADGL